METQHPIATATHFLALDHDMIEMGNAGWQDLRDLADGTASRADQDAVASVQTAFELIADGHGFTEEDLAPHRASFLRALQAEEGEQHRLLTLAMVSMDQAFFSQSN